MTKFICGQSLAAFIGVQEMRTHIHDKLVLQRRGTRCRRIRLLRLSTADGIKRAMDFIHGKEAAAMPDAVCRKRRRPRPC